MVEVRVGVRDLRSNLTRYLKEAGQGNAVLVTSRDVVIAEIRAPTPRRRPPRELGLLMGQIEMADDFDIWPDDILASFET